MQETRWAWPIFFWIFTTLIFSLLPKYLSENASCLYLLPLADVFLYLAHRNQRLWASQLFWTQYGRYLLAVYDQCRAVTPPTAVFETWKCEGLVTPFNSFPFRIRCHKVHNKSALYQISAHNSKISTIVDIFIWKISDDASFFSTFSKLSRSVCHSHWKHTPQKDLQSTVKNVEISSPYKSEESVALYLPVDRSVHAKYLWKRISPLKSTLPHTWSFSFQPREGYIYVITLKSISTQPQHSGVLPTRWKLQEKSFRELYKAQHLKKRNKNSNIYYSKMCVFLVSEMLFVVFSWAHIALKQVSMTKEINDRACWWRWCL